LQALVSETDDASAHRDQARYNNAGHILRCGMLLELQSHVHARKATDRQTALAALVDAWVIAAAVAKNFGFIDLSLAATQRGRDYAELHGGPGVLSFARWYLALGLMRLSARTTERQPCWLRRSVTSHRVSNSPHLTPPWRRWSG